MSDDESMRLSQYKRPRYREGDRVQIDLPGPMNGWHVEVRSVSAIQTLGGRVVTYLYKIKADNHAYLALPEEQLRPIAEA